MITVVAAMILKNNKVLLARRKTGNSSVIGKWEFPGGKVEKGEDECHAIEREIKEEFEIDIKANKFIINNVCKYPDKTIDLRLYECSYLKGTIKLHDHYEYKWVSINEILNFNLCDADIYLAKYLSKK